MRHTNVSPDPLERATRRPAPASAPPPYPALPPALRRLAALLAALLLLSVGCAPRPAGPTVTVAAAASLAPVVEEATTAFRHRHPEVQFRLHFGSSGALRQQIEQGAPIDLYLSAHPMHTDALSARGLVGAGDVRAVARGTLVLVRPVSADLPRDWPDLADPGLGRLALGNPDHVPAGLYGRQALSALGLWSTVQERVVLAEDVAQVLRYVELAEVAAGIVYASDVARSSRVAVVAPAPPDAHAPIVYTMAVLPGRAATGMARGFADFLLAPAGQQLFQRYGFEGAGP